MIIRELTNEDIIQHEYVASQAFVYPFCKENDPLELPHGRMLGAFFDDNKTLMSDLQCENFSGWFFEKKIGCAAVSGVASKPEYRRHGSIRRIFSYVFEHAEEWGYAYSVLYPFSEVFYGKMGYVNAGYYLRLEVPFSQFSHIERNFDVVLYDGTQNESLYRVYNEAAKRSCLGFYRDSDRYFSAKPYATNVYTYIWFNNNNPEGYITFSIDRKSSTVFVSEVAFTNSAALYGLLGFMRTFDGNIDTIIFEKIPMESPILQIIPELEKTKRTIGNIGAVRVLDIKKILSETVFPAATEPFAVCCDDEINRNNGVFYVQPQVGTNKVSFFTEKKEYDIRVDAKAMSKMLLCGLPQNEFSLQFMDGIEFCNNKDSLIRAFAHRSVFFTDGF